MSTITPSVVSSLRPMTNAQLDQLSINCIRTLSMDAVQQAKSGHPGTPMALAARLHALEPSHAFRSARPDLAEPRPVRALQRPCLDAVVVGASPHRHPRGQCRIRTARKADGIARRHSALPPAQQQGPRSPRVPLGLRGRGHHRPPRTGHRHERRHGTCLLLFRAKAACSRIKRTLQMAAHAQQSLRPVMSRSDASDRSVPAGQARQFYSFRNCPGDTPTIWRKRRVK
jgi:Transketolase, thiamine diphosphate binding domain